MCSNVYADVWFEAKVQNVLRFLKVMCRMGKSAYTARPINDHKCIDYSKACFSLYVNVVSSCDRMLGLDTLNEKLTEY